MKDTAHRNVGNEIGKEIKICLAIDTCRMKLI